MVKNLTVKQETWVPSLSQKIPWRRKRQPTPVLPPAEAQGQRSLLGYCPWGFKRVGHNFDTKQQQWHYRFCIYTKVLSSIKKTVLKEVKSCLELESKVKVKVTQSYPILCGPMHYTVHGILQARILDWAAFLFSRGSSQPRNWTTVSCIAGGFFTNWAIRKAPKDKYSLITKAILYCLSKFLA